MKKLLYTTTAVACAALLVAVLWAPAAPVSAQGKPEGTPGQGPDSTPARALLFPSDGSSLSGSCSIDCGDGRTFETDADSTIECACDCASVCGGTCEATNGEEVRTCSAT